MTHEGGRWGAVHYGRLNGLLSAPALLATASAPKYSNRSDTPGSCPISNHRWSASQARILAPTGRVSASNHLSVR